MGLQPDNVAFTLLQDQRESMTVIFALTVVIVFCALALGGMVISHRVAGPLYRLRQHLLAVARGETTNDVKFRDGDFFLDLQAACNQVMGKLRAQSNPAFGRQGGAPPAGGPVSRPPPR